MTQVQFIFKKTKNKRLDHLGGGERGKKKIASSLSPTADKA